MPSIPPDVKQIIDEALRRGQYALSEYESKQILGAYGIPVIEEVLVRHIENLLTATEKIGYPYSY